MYLVNIITQGTSTGRLRANTPAQLFAFDSKSWLDCDFLALPCRFFVQTRRKSTRGVGKVPTNTPKCSDRQRISATMPRRGCSVDAVCRGLMIGKNHGKNAENAGGHSNEHQEFDRLIKPAAQQPHHPLPRTAPLPPRRPLARPPRTRGGTSSDRLRAKTPAFIFLLDLSFLLYRESAYHSFILCLSFIYPLCVLPNRSQNRNVLSRAGAHPDSSECPSMRGRSCSTATKRNTAAESYCNEHQDTQKRQGSR